MESEKHKEYLEMKSKSRKVLNDIRDNCESFRKLHKIINYEDKGNNEELLYWIESLVYENGHLKT